MNVFALLGILLALMAGISTYGYVTHRRDEERRRQEELEAQAFAEIAIAINRTIVAVGQALIPAFERVAKACTEVVAAFRDAGLLELAPDDHEESSR